MSSSSNSSSVSSESNGSSNVHKDVRYRAKDAQRGIKQLNIRVPVETAHYFQMLAQACRDNPDLLPGPGRHRVNGQLVRVDY